MKCSNWGTGVLGRCSNYRFAARDDGGRYSGGGGAVSAQNSEFPSKPSKSTCPTLTSLRLAKNSTRHFILLRVSPNLNLGNCTQA